MKKKSNLEKLQETSGMAIKVLTDTIDVLEQTNKDIEDEKLVIANTISRLTDESKSLSDLRDKNSRIISNFKALLN
jgi:hypothetical protein